MLLLILVARIVTAFSLDPIKSVLSSDQYETCHCEDFDSENFRLHSHLSIGASLLKITGYKQCQYTNEPIKRIERHLYETVIGQNKALRTIINHISSHLARKKKILQKSPLVLHFAGDFGVGKTLAASIISTFLFKGHSGEELVDHSATLLISGAKYLSRNFGKKSNESQIKKVQMIRKEIVNQLRKCPKSLIILNDLQKMDMSIFENLEDFFEGTAYTEKRQVSTKEAIFIFTSDFGSADISRGWSFGKMETEIKKRFSLYTNFNKKLGSLVVHVPFKTLGKKEMKEIFKNELLNTLSCSDRFECVRFDKRVVDFLVSKWESSEIIKKMNGRAFHKYIYPTFVDEEIQRTKNLLKVKGKKRHLKLAIKKNGDKDFLKADLAFEFKKLNKKDL